MKRSTKMILLLMVVAALACSYLAVQNFSQKETVEAADVEYPLLSGAEVTAISWASGDENISLEQQDGAWTMADDAAFPVDQEKAADMAADIGSLTARRQLTGVESLADYGLDAPLFSVTVSLADGTAATIEQGGDNSLSGQTYVRVSGDDSVYLVDDAPAEILDAARDDLLAMESVPEIGDIMTIELSSHETVRKIRYESGDNYVDPDTGKAMDAEAVSTFIDMLTGIQWTGVASYTATAEDKANWLLDDPVAKVVVSSTITEELEDGGVDIQVVEYTLIIGNVTEDNENVYAMIDADSSMVYTLANADAEAVYDALQGSLESAQVIAVDWGELQQLSLMMGAQTIHVEKVTVEAPTETENTAEDGTSDGETADGAVVEEAPVETEQWQMNGTAVNEQLWNRLTALIDGLEFAEAETVSGADEYLVLAFEAADGSAKTLTLVDESADAYGIANEPKTVPADVIDEIVRILRHLV